MVWFPLIGISSSNESTCSDEEEETVILNPSKWTISDLDSEALIKVGSAVGETFILS